MLAGGEPLLPGSLLQLWPQRGVAGLSTKPLKAAGAEPPLSVFAVPHWAPQKVTLPVLKPEAVMAAARSPITNEPPKAKPLTMTVLAAVADWPPSSTMLTVTECRPG